MTAQQAPPEAQPPNVQTGQESGNEFTARFKAALVASQTPAPDKPAPAPPPGKAEEAPPDKPAEKTPPKAEVQDHEPPADLNPKQAATWKQLREDRKAALKERDELRAKYETDVQTAKQERARIEAELARVKTEFKPDEVAKLKSERDDFYKKLRLKDIDALPDVQREIITPMKRAIDHAASLVPAEHRSRLKALLESEPTDSRDEALNEFAEGLSAWRAAAFAKDIADLDAKRQARTDMLRDTDALVKQYDAWESEQVKGKEQASLRQREETFTEVLAACQDPKNGLPVFQKVDGDEKHNAAVDQATATLKQLCTGPLDPKVAMANMAWSVFGQALAPQLIAYEKEVESLKAQVAKLTSTTPKASTSAQAGTEEKPMTFVEAFRKTMAGV